MTADHSTHPAAGGSEPDSMDAALLRRWWPLPAVVALILGTALAAAGSTPNLRRVQPPVDVAPTLPDYQRPTAEPVPTGGVAEAVRETGLPGWLVPAALTVLGLLLAVVVALLAWFVVRDQLRRRAGRATRSAVPGQRPSTAEDVVAALDAGLEDLSDNDRDPRRAVIACWVRLEQAAAAAGTARRPGDTPADLVGRLLAEQQVSAEVLAGLAHVYREARYATHTVDDRMRVEARAALQRLRGELTAGLAP